MSFIPIPDNRLKNSVSRYPESDCNRNDLCHRLREGQSSIRKARIAYPKPNPSQQQTQSSGYRPIVSNHPNHSNPSNQSKPSKSSDKCNKSYVNSSAFRSSISHNNSAPDYSNSHIFSDKGFKSEKKFSVNSNESKLAKDRDSEHLDHIWSNLPIQVWQTLMSTQSSTVALCARESSSETSSAEVLSSLHSSSDFESSSSEDSFVFTGLSTPFQPLSYTILQ